MADKTKKQVAQASVMLGMWLQSGEKIWEFMPVDAVMTDVKVKRNLVDTNELANYAIEQKRKGDYAEAVGAYMGVMSAFVKKTGRIPVVHVRGLFKVLLCTNDFALAFQLVSTVYADMQNTSRRVDSQESMLFKQYFMQMLQLIVAVVDDNNFAWAEAIARNYSGSSFYTMQKTNSEIKAEITPFRNEIRQIYGM